MSHVVSNFIVTPIQTQTESCPIKFLRRPIVRTNQTIHTERDVWAERVARQDAANQLGCPHVIISADVKTCMYAYTYLCLLQFQLVTPPYTGDRGFAFAEFC